LYYPYGLFAPAFWWGFNWGWGYYPPYYPANPAAGVYPVYPGPGAYVVPVPPPEPYRIATRLELRGAGQNGGGGATGGIDFFADGRHTGFHTSIEAVSLRSVTGHTALDTSSALGWGTMHLTWSFFATDAARLRLELGGSLLSMPNSATFAGRPYAGAVVFGPNVGTSGHIRLIGPLGIEGHVRLMPVPVAVTDSSAALALRGGPIAISGGWRWVDVAGSGTNAPQLHFSGPQIGLSLLF
jgi:hypothetical protein